MKNAIQWQHWQHWRLVHDQVCRNFKGSDSNWTRKYSNYYFWNSIRSISIRDPIPLCTWKKPVLLHCWSYIHCRQDAEIMEIHLICEPLQQPCHWDVFPKKRRILTKLETKTKGWIWQNMTWTLWNMMNMMKLTLKTQGFVCWTFAYCFGNCNSWQTTHHELLTAREPSPNPASNGMFLRTSRHWTSQKFWAKFVHFLGSELFALSHKYIIIPP